MNSDYLCVNLGDFTVNFCSCTAVSQSSYIVHFNSLILVSMLYFSFRAVGIQSIFFGISIYGMIEFNSDFESGTIYGGFGF